MSSNLKVNNILPSTGTNIGLGTASGTLNVDGGCKVQVGTALTLGHTQGVQFHTQNLHSEGFEINQINASGIVTASSFSGSGANLTSIPAGNLTGTVADARISTLTASKLTGALPALDGSALTGVGVGTADSINTSGIITATAFVSTNQNLSHRNKIINGSQQIFQRGTSDERYGGNDGYYNGIADRWAIRMHSSVAQTTYSKDTSDTPDGFGSCQKSVRSNAGSASASKYYVYDTKLEGQDLQDFAKGTSSAKEFTLSFYVKTGVSGVYCIEMRDLDNSRMVGGTYTVSNGNWNRYIITFPADTTGAFGNDNGASLWVRFWLAAGSNFTSGTARTAWASGAPDSVLAVGQTAQVGDNVADTWRITGIQLEVGSTATAFEHRSYADEFRRCARYCYQWIDDQQLGFGQVYSGSGYIKIFPPIPVNMRAKPSVTKNAPSGYWFVSYHGNSGYAGDRNVSVEGNSGDDNLQSANSFRIFVHGGSNQGNAVTCWCLIHDTAGAYLRLEAEL